MPEKRTEPWVMASMTELLSFARAMEQEAVDGYIALAARMRAEERPDLAAVFDGLVAEEEGHLGKVDQWLGEGGARTYQPPRTALRRRGGGRCRSGVADIVPRVFHGGAQRGAGLRVLDLCGGACAFRGNQAGRRATGKGGTGPCGDTASRAPPRISRDAPCGGRLCEGGLADARGAALRIVDTHPCGCTRRCCGAVARLGERGAGARDRSNSNAAWRNASLAARSRERHRAAGRTLRIPARLLSRPCGTRKHRGGKSTDAEVCQRHHPLPLCSTGTLGCCPAASPSQALGYSGDEANGCRFAVISPCARTSAKRRGTTPDPPRPFHRFPAVKSRLIRNNALHAPLTKCSPIIFRLHLPEGRRRSQRRSPWET